jgi:hypothetical protein
MGGYKLTLLLLMKVTDVRLIASIVFMIRRLTKMKMMIREESPPHLWLTSGSLLTLKNPVKGNRLTLSNIF